MRLTVKRGDNLISELRFSRGPIYIGRQIGSQIFLPDRAVSRQHTVIYTTTDGQWIAEDLDSANKTYLNEEAIHKVEIKNGDVLHVADFTIEIWMEDQDDEQSVPISLDDTLHATLHEPQIVIRDPSSDDSPMIRMPSRRMKNLSAATGILSGAKTAEKLLQGLLTIIKKQFSPFRIWVALRNSPSGAMTLSAGKSRGGLTVKLEELVLENKIQDAVNNHNYILIPRLPLQSAQQEKINSALIAPLLCENACFGVIYVDNSTNHEHFNLSDLDYLALIAIHAAAIIKSL